MYKMQIHALLLACIVSWLIDGAGWSFHHLGTGIFSSSDVSFDQWIRIQQENGWYNIFLVDNTQLK